MLCSTECTIAYTSVHVLPLHLNTTTTAAAVVAATAATGHTASTLHLSHCHYTMTAESMHHTGTTITGSATDLYKAEHISRPLVAASAVACRWGQLSVGETTCTALLSKCEVQTLSHTSVQVVEVCTGASPVCCRTLSPPVHAYVYACCVYVCACTVCVSTLAVAF